MVGTFGSTHIPSSPRPQPRSYLDGSTKWPTAITFAKLSLPRKTFFPLAVISTSTERLRPDARNVPIVEPASCVTAQTEPSLKYMSINLIVSCPPATVNIYSGLCGASNRQRVTTTADAITLISATPPGTTLTIVVVRDGVQQTLSVLVGTRPARNLAGPISANPASGCRICA